MYFVIKKYGGLSRVVARAHKIFGQEFNEKLFRVQLAYFKDLDFSERVIFMPGLAVKASEIQNRLKQFSLGK